MTPEREDLARLVRMRMAELNMSKKELSEKTGLSTRRITSICEGTCDVSIRDVASLEDALGECFMLIPDIMRTITISMDIDSHRHQAAVGMVVQENGRPKNEWTYYELIATANALTMKARALMEQALVQMLDKKEEQKDE